MHARLQTVLACGSGLAFAAVALANVHDFPSDDSTVVGSSGFIDDDEVGYFWSRDLGHSVEETFADPAPSIERLVWDYDILFNSLGDPCNWRVLVNGEAVGEFSVVFGQLGPQQVDFSFDPVAAVGGEYTVRAEVTNVVRPGAGSMSLRYALAGPHQVELFESAGCYADCDGSGTLDFFDFLCFQNAFAGGDPYADCDDSGTLDFFDFLCFQNEFAAGCP